MKRYTLKEMACMSDDDLRELIKQKNNRGRYSANSRLAGKVLYARHHWGGIPRYCHVNIDLDYYEHSGRYGER